MTTEQREILAKIAELNFLLEGQAKEEFSPVLQEVLSLIKEQSAELLQKNTELAEKNAEIEKKDKIIDLMSEQLAGLTIWNTEKDEPLILTDKEEVINYFENKVNSKIQ